MGFYYALKTGASAGIYKYNWPELVACFECVNKVKEVRYEVAKMTEKQRRFADEYIISGNATEAYKKAYPTVKKDGAARANGSKLLTNTNISNYIDERLNELQSEKVADQQEVLEYLTSVMRREHKESTVVTLTKEKSEWVDGKKQTVKEEVPEIVEIPARLSDANKAAELLGKRYIMWTDKQISDSTERITIVDDLDE